MKPRNRQTSKRQAPAPQTPASAPTPAPASPTGQWLPTLLLIGGGWAALLVCALLWRLLTGGPLLVYFLAAVIGVCFTIAAVFSHIFLSHSGGDS